MKINIYFIAKMGKDDRLYDEIIDSFICQCKSFGAQMNLVNCFNNAIIKAQKLGSNEARQAYTNAFIPFIATNCLNIAMCEQGKSLDSLDFAKLLESSISVNFFIGGAYGLESSFLDKCKKISLSKLTLSHKIAKLALCEQVFRALSIIHNHPYHK